MVSAQKVTCPVSVNQDLRTDGADAEEIPFRRAELQVDVAAFSAFQYCPYAIMDDI